MTNKTRKQNYEVGYRKPPKENQFKPGQSGNYRGREKGVKNLKTIVKDEVDDKLAIVVDGKRIYVTKLEAAVKTLTAKAIQGDAKAAGLFFKMVKDLILDQEDGPELAELTDADKSILDAFTHTIVATVQGKESSDDE